MTEDHRHTYIKFDCFLSVKMASHDMRFPVLFFIIFSLVTGIKLLEAEWDASAAKTNCPKRTWTF